MDGIRPGEEAPMTPSPAKKKTGPAEIRRKPPRDAEASPEKLGRRKAVKPSRPGRGGAPKKRPALPSFEVIRLSALFENMLDGFALCRMTYRRGRPEDFVYLAVNRPFEELTGLKNVIGKKVSEVIPGVHRTNPELLEIYGRVASGGNAERFESYIPTLDIWFSVSVYSPKRGQFIALFENVTARKSSEEELNRAVQRFDLAADAAGACVWDWDIRTGRLVWDNRMYALYGVNRSDFVVSYESWLQCLHPDDRAVQDAVSRRARRDLESYDTRFRVARPDGSVRHVRALGRFIRNAEGEPIRMTGVNIDMTEMVDAKEGAAAVETRYRETLDSILEGCQILAFDWRYLYLNDVVCGQAHRSRSEMLGRTFIEIWPGIESTELFTIMRRCMQNRTAETMENRFDFPDGTKGWFDLRIYPVPEGIVIFSVDVTDRRRAEEALRESEDKFKYFFDHSPVGKSITSPSGGLSVNLAFSDLLGYPTEEMRGKSWRDITHPDDHATSQRMIDELLSGARESDRMEKRYLRADGSVFWADVNTSLRRDSGGKPLYFMTTVIDISDRKAAEKALEESNERLRTLIDSSPVAIFCLDPDGTVRLWNPSAENLFGWSEQEARGRFLPIVPADKMEEHGILRGKLNRGESFTNLEITRRRKDGTPVEISLSAAPVRDAEGRITVLMCVAADIGERKRAEEALHESEERFRGLYENATAGLYRTTPDGRILLANPALSEMLGFASPEDLKKRNLASADFDPDHPRSEFLEAIERDGQVKGFESAWKRIDATVIYVRESARAVRDRLGRTLYYDGIAEDITERRTTEEALHLAHERLRSFIDLNIIGVLTADASGAITEANDYYLNLIGCGRHELESGRIDWRALTPPEWIPADEKAIRELRETGRCRPYEKEYQRRDGSRVPVLLVDALLPGPDHRIAAFALDLTERKKAEAEIRRQLEELKRWHDVTLDRETRVLELKHEVNVLLGRLNEPIRYPSAES
jgi:PAS domain S-box-containing protein